MGDVVVTDDSCRLWVQRTGQGQPLLLCHGGPGLWDMFGDLAQMLAGTARVMHRALPRSQRLTIAHAGHLPWAEAAGALRAAVSEFLATPTAF